MWCEVIIWLYFCESLSPWYQSLTMTSTQPINNRHEITIEEEEERAYNPTHLEGNDDNITESTRQDAHTNGGNPSNTPVPSMEYGSNISTPTTTPQMLRQALAEVPDPSQFLHTPSHENNSDLSWDIDEEEEVLSMYAVLRESFQATTSDFSLFSYFDVLWLNKIESFDFQQCIDGSTKH